jgi:hypothetical protein
VSIGGLSSFTSSDRNFSGANSVWIYGNADIRIQDGSAVARDILTYGNGVPAGGGSVTIEHDGTFLAASIQTWSSSQANNSGSVVINGDILANGASGTLTVRGIAAYKLRPTAVTGSGNAGAVTVVGYTNVWIGTNGITAFAGAADRLNLGNAGNITITNIGAGGIRVDGPIYTYAYGDNATRTAGNVTLRSSGAIRISGDIDASNYAGGGSAGNISFTSTNGIVYVKDLDCAKVGTATFSSRGGYTYIENALLNFDKDNPLTSHLDAVTGQTVRYSPRVKANAYLNLRSYTLASGGMLSPIPAKGMVITIR